jgi:choline-sulfatase
MCADDLAAHAIGAYGNPRVRTPHIDALAAQGMRFDRAFCNSPVCTASRQSFLTGRYPRTIGVTALKTPLPEAETTLAELLKAAGYDTAAIGKMHFNSNLKHGFDLRLDTADHRKVLNQRGAQPIPSGLAVQPPWKPFKDHARTWLNSNARPIGNVDADMPGTWFAEEAARYLATKRDKPFFLMVSFYEPHSPFHFPIEYRDRHRPDEFNVPQLGPDDAVQVPAIFRHCCRVSHVG